MEVWDQISNLESITLYVEPGTNFGNIYMKSFNGKPSVKFDFL